MPDAGKKSRTDVLSKSGVQTREKLESRLVFSIQDTNGIIIKSIYVASEKVCFDFSSTFYYIYIAAMPMSLKVS